MSFNKVKYQVVLTGMLCFGSLFQTSCKKEIDEIENLNNNEVGVVGHAGAGFRSYDRPLPDNSFSSTVKAIEAYNASGVEVDVQLSQDNKLFLYHDNKLSSKTNFDGCIYNYTASQLRNCVFRNSDERLTTLDTIVKRFAGREPKPIVFLDVRTATECNQTVNHENYLDILAGETVKIIQKYQAYEWIMVEAQDTAFLNRIKKLDERVKLIMDGGSNFPTAISYATENQLFGLIFSNKDVTKEQIQIAHQKGLRVSLFDLPSRKETAEGINKSPDFIQTDNIPLLQQLLND